MDEKLYRCGWCGSPTNKSGKCYELADIPNVSNERWDKAIKVTGECCTKYLDNGYENINIQKPYQ